MSGTAAGPFGFAGDWGYQGDGDSGPKLFGHRYYDPLIGRFLTRDPIKDGRNWNSYCGNNPLKWVDPEGLQTRRKEPAKAYDRSRRPKGWPYGKCASGMSFASTEGNKNERSQGNQGSERGS